MIKANTAVMPPSVQRQLAKIECVCLDLILGHDPPACRQPAKSAVQCREKPDVLRTPENPNSRAVMGGDLPRDPDSFDVPAFTRIDRLIDNTHEGGLKGGVEDPAAARAKIQLSVLANDACLNTKASRKT